MSPLAASKSHGPTTILMATLVAGLLSIPGIQAGTVDNVERAAGCIQDGNFIGDYPGLMQFHHTIETGTGTTVTQDEPPLLGYFYNNLVYKCGIDVEDNIVYACVITVEEGSQFTMTADVDTLLYKGAVPMIGGGDCGPGGFDFSSGLLDLPCDGGDCTNYSLEADGSTALSLVDI